jgi:hypothetical protein
MDYEAWRPALAAFYRADCWFQTAEHLERGGKLTPENKRHIRALQAAFIVQAVNTPHRKAA